MKILVYLIFLLSLGSVYGQTGIAVSTKADTVKPGVVFLLGSWQEDTTAAKIEFKIVHNDLYLVTPDAYSFLFFYTDSLPLNGVSITWPPHDCVVKKLGKDRIEIQYTFFGAQPMVSRYRKINVL